MQLQIKIKDNLNFGGIGFWSKDKADDIKRALQRCSNVIVESVTLLPNESFLENEKIYLAKILYSLGQAKIKNVLSKLQESLAKTHGTNTYSILEYKEGLEWRQYRQGSIFDRGFSLTNEKSDEEEEFGFGQQFGGQLHKSYKPLDCPKFPSISSIHDFAKFGIEQQIGEHQHKPYNQKSMFDPSPSSLNLPIDDVPDDPFDPFSNTF